VDGALERSFPKKLIVNASTEEESIEILTNIKDSYENTTMLYIQQKPSMLV
jgi:ATP-dependent Clp protease ATP-binding subunit ClpA